MKRIIKRKVKGFVLTFELIMTLAMMSVFMTITLFYLSAFDAQRYMNTVLTSTIIQMSNCGGYSNRYTRLNGINNVLDAANNELSRLQGYNARISGSPDSISVSNQKVQAKLEWRYPKIILLNFIISLEDVERELELEMDSLVQPGSLLR